MRRSVMFAQVFVPAKMGTVFQNKSVFDSIYVYVMQFVVWLLSRYFRVLCKILEIFAF